MRPVSSLKRIDTMENKNVLSCIGLLALAMVAPIISAFTNGFVLTKLWEWFIVPVPMFHAASLSLISAMGISLIVSLLTHQTEEKGKDERETSEKVIAAVMRIVVGPFIFLFFGWLYLALFA
jgi:hypothetical protein